jgi:glycogen synthase
MFVSFSTLGADGYVITTLEGEYSHRKMGAMLIENRPPPSKLAGIKYHLAHLFWMIRLLPSLLLFKPDILIITTMQSYWFSLSLLAWRGIQIVPALHCTLWPKFRQPKRSWQYLLRLGTIFPKESRSKFIDRKWTTEEMNIHFPKCRICVVYRLSKPGTNVNCS